MSNWTRKDFNPFFEAVNSTPWKRNQVDAFEQLVLNDCQTSEQRKMVFDLIPLFYYLTLAQFSDEMDKLATQIINDPDLTEDNCQIVSITNTDYADSSQMVLYNLKPILAKKGWRNVKLTNRFARCGSVLKKFPHCKNIVLVDEFLGTGQTLLNRFREVHNNLSNQKIGDFSIRAKIIVAMDFGLQTLLDDDLNVSALQILPKGISGNFPKNQAMEKLDLMRKIESVLGPIYKDKEMPSLGFGESEALYGREDGNAPNNVFSVFWWPYYFKGQLRKTILTRAMGDA